MQRHQRAQNTKRNITYQFALWIVSTAVFGLYLLLAAENHFPHLEPLIDGTAPRPYVYRILAPFIVRVISSVLGVSPFLCAIIVMYVTMIGASWLLLALSEIFFPKYSRKIALLAPIGLIPLLIEQRQIYDFPTLFLFALALYYLARNDFRKYIIAFALATLSKETSLFLLIFFVIQFRGLDKKKFLLLVVVQAALYALIRFALIMTFRNNPGGLLEFHLSEHLNAYLQHPSISMVLFAVMVGLVGVGVYQAVNQPGFVQNSLVAIGVPTLLMYFLFGVPFEVRIFMESYPSIFLSVSLAGITFFGRFAKGGSS